MCSLKRIRALARVCKPASILNQRAGTHTRFALQLASRVVEQVVDMDKQLLLFLKQVRNSMLACARCVSMPDQACIRSIARV